MHSQRGQAAVELVAVLPLAVAVLAALWQLAVFAHTAWLTSSAAHAAATPSRPLASVTAPRCERSRTHRPRNQRSAPRSEVSRSGSRPHPRSGLYPIRHPR